MKWIKCQNDVWCKLDTVNLEHSHFNSMYGVYIIWHGGSSAATVRVGQGNIRERLAAHRIDPEIQKYQNLGLYVTWASVAAEQINGVEHYLYQTLNPKATERSPEAPQIPVNLPW